MAGPKISAEDIKRQIADPSGGWRPIASVQAHRKLDGLLQTGENFDGTPAKLDVYVKEVETPEGKVRFYAQQNGIFLASELNVSGLWKPGSAADQSTPVKILDFSDGEGTLGELAAHDRVQILKTRKTKSVWFDFTVEGDQLIRSGVWYSTPESTKGWHPIGPAAPWNPNVGYGDPGNIINVVGEEIGAYTSAMDLIGPVYEHALKALVSEPESEKEPGPEEPPPNVSGPSE